jgi:hypothetical protein
MIAYQVAPRIAWCRSLWARRAELNGALHARLTNVPQFTAGAAAEVGTLP